MTMHVIDYEIIGDDLQFVEVELDPGEARLSLQLRDPVRPERRTRIEPGETLPLHGKQGLLLLFGKGLPQALGESGVLHERFALAGLGLRETGLREQRDRDRRGAQQRGETGGADQAGPLHRRGSG